MLRHTPKQQKPSQLSWTYFVFATLMFFFGVRILHTHIRHNNNNYYQESGFFLIYIVIKFYEYIIETKKGKKRTKITIGCSLYCIS